MFDCPVLKTCSLRVALHAAVMQLMLDVQNTWTDVRFRFPCSVAEVKDLGKAGIKRLCLFRSAANCLWVGCSPCLAFKSCVSDPPERPEVTSWVSDAPHKLQTSRELCVFVRLLRGRGGAAEAGLQSERRVLLRVLPQQSRPVQRVHHLGGPAHPKEVSSRMWCLRVSRHELTALPHGMGMAGSAGKAGLEVRMWG